MFIEFDGKALLKQKNLEDESEIRRFQKLTHTHAHKHTHTRAPIRLVLSTI